ncbi:MAG: hypothetical protein ABI760_00365 [Ferruginibacter sp.]
MTTKQPLIVSAIVLLICFTQQANAKIWRVNNNANATNGSNLGGSPGFPVFEQLFGNATNSANGNNLVKIGDTVHLEGSTNNYAGGDLTKKLTIIGPGFFLNENPNTSNNVLPAKLTYITFTTGSSGSQLIGVHVGGSSYGVSINVSDILVRRCKVDVDLSLYYGISDIRILQNFFSRVSTATTITTSGYGFPTDVIFNNNIILGNLVLPVGYAMLECKNNVFAGPSISSSPSIRMYVGSFQNNLLKDPSAIVDINGGTNMNVTYNTGADAAQFGTTNNNLVIADMSTLFVAAGTSDGKYQLKPGSANGSDGTERGAYGGASVINRYTLSGLAPIPVIYDISTSGVADATGLPVIIKARIIK